MLESSRNAFVIKHSHDIFIIGEKCMKNLFIVIKDQQAWVLLVVPLLISFYIFADSGESLFKQKFSNNQQGK